MSYERMMELFENGYTFFEIVDNYGTLLKLELADLELIAITDYVITEKDVIVRSWEYN